MGGGNETEEVTNAHGTTCHRSSSLYTQALKGVSEYSINMKRMSNIMSRLPKRMRMMRTRKGEQEEKRGPHLQKVQVNHK